MTNTAHPDRIVFGGSFDPPHLGHVETIRLVQERFPESRIMILPAATPARAQGDTKPGPTASFTQRLAMCRLAFAGSPDVTVSDLEGRLPSPNYTVRTLTHLHEEAPEERLGWIMGADQLRAFSRWHEPRRILSLAHLIVLPRADDLLRASDVSVLLDEVGGDRSVVTVLETAPPPYASRTIRANLRSQSTVEGLPREVAAYIESQHLYREEEEDGAT